MRVQICLIWEHYNVSHNYLHFIQNKKQKSQQKLFPFDFAVKWNQVKSHFHEIKNPAQEELIQGYGQCLYVEASVSLHVRAPWWLPRRGIEILPAESRQQHGRWHIDGWQVMCSRRQSGRRQTLLSDRSQDTQRLLSRGICDGHFL